MLRFLTPRRQIRRASVGMPSLNLIIIIFYWTWRWNCNQLVQVLIPARWHTEASGIQMQSKCPLRVNKRRGAARYSFHFWRFLVCLIKNNVWEDAGKETLIRPDPRLLVCVWLHNPNQTEQTVWPSWAPPRSRTGKQNLSTRRVKLTLATALQYFPSLPVLLNIDKSWKKSMQL